MRFFRHRSKLGWLPLLALAVQGALAFAHSHEHVTPRPQQLEARAMTFGACPPGIDEPCAPAHRHNDQVDCAICWATHLAGSGLLATAPTLERVVEPSTTQLALLRDADLRGNASVQFQARAPPHLRTT